MSPAHLYYQLQLPASAAQSNARTHFTAPLSPLRTMRTMYQTVAEILLTFLPLSLDILKNASFTIHAEEVIANPRDPSLNINLFKTSVKQPKRYRRTVSKLTKSCQKQASFMISTTAACSRLRLVRSLSTGSLHHLRKQSRCCSLPP